MNTAHPKRQPSSPPGRTGRMAMWRPLLVLVCLVAVCTGYTVFAGGSLKASTGQQENRKGRAEAAPDVAGQAGLPKSAADQIGALLLEKANRTPAQQKMDSQLVYAAKQKSGKAIAAGVTDLQPAVTYGKDGLVRVDIRTRVTGPISSMIKGLGGVVEATYAHSDSVIARLPIESIESLASNEDVVFVSIPSPAMTNKAEAPAMTGGVAGPPSAAEAREERLNAFRERVKTSLAAHNGQEPVRGVRNDGDKAEKGDVYSTRASDDPIDESAGKSATKREPAAAGFTPKVGLRDSEGDRTHRSRDARNAFGINGTGLKIGVISDSFNNLGAYNADIASGDLPGPGNPNGFTTPVQFAGSGDLASGGSDEGRAMAQIIHDVAPGAQLYFATAFNSIGDFANSIAALGGLSTFRGQPVTGTIVPGGCDVIVDDIFYFVESPVHKGQTAALTSAQNIAIVTEAVNAVTAAGKLYFSSAGNSNGVTQSTAAATTAGAWEGDFVSGGNLTIPGVGSVEVHDWDPTAAVAQSNNITASSIPILHWADPIGGSANDYDFFVLNSTLTTVVQSSANIQNGTQDPIEPLLFNIAANNRLVIVRKAGAATRFLSVTTNRGRIQFATTGQTRGHSCAENGYGVAATPAAATFGAPTPNGPFPGPFTSASQVEPFNSDGPRRVFFNADGTAVTPGDFTATGGQILNKPDITAADGTSTTVAGFATFYGTSAAAPHAAAISALVKAAAPSFTPAQVRNILTSTALDIMAPGVDRDAGVGVIQAFQAVQATGVAGVAFLDRGTTTLAKTGGGQILPGDSATLTVQLSNVGVANATGISATVTSSTPGITVTSGTSAYTDLAPAASANNTTPFTISVGAQTPCPLTINFSMTVTYAGGSTPSQVFPFSVATATPLVINETLNTTAPAANPAYTAITGTQTGRLNRFTPGSVCGVTKANPGLAATTGARQFDAYTFPAASVPQCINFSLTDLTGTTPKIFLAAYLGAFNPASVGTNYGGDTGGSPSGGGAAATGALTVPAGVSLTIVVHEVNVAGAPNNNYRITVDGFACAIPGASIIPPAGAVTVTEGAGADGDTFVEPCENGNVTVAVSNRGGTPATGVSGTITTSTPGVTITSATAAYPDIAVGATSANTTPFTFTSLSNVPCNSTVNCTLTLTYGGGASGSSPVVIPFTFTIGRQTNYAFASSTGGVIPGNPGNTQLIPGSQADDAIALVNAPFNFKVYDTLVPQGVSISVSTNGTIQFVSTGANSAFSNTALPATAFPTAPALFPYWDDLDSDPASVVNGGVFTQVLGTAPNRQWVVEWRTKRFGDVGTAQTLNFAVVFNEGTNRFNYVYAQTGVSSANGVSATVGAQNTNSGTGFTQFSLNAANITPGLQLDATRAVACDVCPSANTSVAFTVTNQSFPSLVGCAGYSNQAVLTATLTNTGSATLNNIQYEVLELREGSGAPPANPFRLRSAVGASCGTGGLVGSRQNGPTSLAAGASSTTETFTIDMPSLRRFRFIISVIGTESFGSPGFTTSGLNKGGASRLASALVEVDANGKVVAVTPINRDQMPMTVDATPKAAEKK